MDRLWAIKKNFDPFKWIAGIGPVGIAALARCTYYGCPYCRWPFKITWGPSNSLLGSGEKVCWHCKQVFCDGSKEWPKMTGDERQHFLLPVSVAGWLAGTFVVMGMLIFVFWNGPSASVTNVWILGVLSAPLALWFAYRGFQIFRSIRRYNQRGSKETA
jgi:hypothetical protein